MKGTVGREKWRKEEREGRKEDRKKRMVMEERSEKQAGREKWKKEERKAGEMNLEEGREEWAEEGGGGGKK